MKAFFRKRLSEWFALDYRSLAFLRIGIAFTLLSDLVSRATDLFVHYSDGGLLPRSAVLAFWNNTSFFSFHFLNGAAWFQGLLFFIAGVFAVMLLFGYRTRLATIVSWVFLISLHARNPLVLQGGDVVLRVILFWMMFLPLAKRYSLDRFLNRIPAPEHATLSSVETAAYLFQICLVYLFAGITKIGPTWIDGSAGYLALSLDQFATSFGVYLRQFPSLLRAGTYAVWDIEIFGSLLFFFPFRVWFFRLIGIALFVGIQIAFNTSLHLGLFGMIAITSLLGLLPTEFWNGFQKVFQNIRRRGKQNLKIYYDADCTFCFKGTSLIRRLFLHPNTHIAPASENGEVQKVMLEKNSWVVVNETGQYFFEWEGAIEVARASFLFAWISPLLRTTPVSFLGKKLYRFVASHRKNVCTPVLVKKPLKYFSEIQNIKKGVILFLIAYIFLWNLGTIRSSLIPENMKWIGYITRLDQAFNLFAPNPLTEDGWYVFPGMLRDGTSVDVYRGGALSYLKPDSLLYKNQRWQKYMMNLWDGDFAKYRLYYGQYLCREWNKNHPTEKNLMKFNMVFMLKKTPKQGEKPEPIKPVTIWQHSCF